MTAEEIANLDRALMQVFDRNDSRFGLGLDPVLSFLIGMGFPDQNRGFVLARIEKLVSVDHFLERVNKDTNRAIRTWRVTPEGVQWLEDQGL